MKFLNKSLEAKKNCSLDVDKEVQIRNVTRNWTVSRDATVVGEGDTHPRSADSKLWNVMLVPRQGIFFEYVGIKDGLFYRCGSVHRISFASKLIPTFTHQKVQHQIKSVLRRNNYPSWLCLGTSAVWWPVSNAASHHSERLSLAEIGWRSWS